jgi:hypothetical protein
VRRNAKSTGVNRGTRAIGHEQACRPQRAGDEDPDQGERHAPEPLSLGAVAGIARQQHHGGED